ncbi:hypothetical protein Bbelb_256090 [Branchiostoma belcheri]|nr:hypothetical protein Bbelb_256090 [Branchiostoma belcheri]
MTEILWPSSGSSMPVWAFAPATLPSRTPRNDGQQFRVVFLQDNRDFKGIPYDILGQRWNTWARRLAIYWEKAMRSYESPHHLFEILPGIVVYDNSCQKIVISQYRGVTEILLNEVLSYHGLQQHDQDPRFQRVRQQQTSHLLSFLLYTTDTWTTKTCCPARPWADEAAKSGGLAARQAIPSVFGQESDSVKGGGQRTSARGTPPRITSELYSLGLDPLSRGFVSAMHTAAQLAEKDELDILGVTVDKKLTWAKHISNVGARAGQKLGDMRRVAQKLDTKGRATVYKAQKKALRINGVNEHDTTTELNIPPLLHRRQVAAVSLIYKMHMSTCPPDLKNMLLQPYTIRRTTRSSLSTGKHALTVPVSRTHATGRTFIHTAVDIWNSLPDNVVGRITDNNLQHRRFGHRIGVVKSRTAKNANTRLYRFRAATSRMEAIGEGFPTAAILNRASRRDVRVYMYVERLNAGTPENSARPPEQTTSEAGTSQEGTQAQRRDNSTTRTQAQRRDNSATGTQTLTPQGPRTSPFRLNPDSPGTSPLRLNPDTGTSGQIEGDISDRGFDVPEGIGGRIGRAAQLQALMKLIVGHLVLSILLYGAETWTLTAAQERRLDAFDSKCQRRILGIRWFDHVSTDALREQTNQPPPPPLSSKIRSARLRLLGHIARAEPPLELGSVVREPPPSTWSRPRGRPRRTWTDLPSADLQAAELDITSAWVLSRDRKTWRAPARDFLTRCFVFVGPPGCGKSRLVREYLPDETTTYYKPEGGWFDGYMDALSRHPCTQCGLTDTPLRNLRPCGAKSSLTIRHPEDTVRDGPRDIRVRQQLQQYRQCRLSKGVTKILESYVEAQNKQSLLSPQCGEDGLAGAMGVWIPFQRLKTRYCINSRCIQESIEAFNLYTDADDESSSDDECSSDDKGEITFQISKSSANKPANSSSRLLPKAGRATTREAAHCKILQAPGWSVVPPRSDKRDPVKEGWVAFRGVTIHFEAGALPNYIDRTTQETRERVVYFRPTTGNCDCRLPYDGQEDLLFNFSNKVMYSYSYLFAYLHNMMESQHSLRAYHRACQRTNKMSTTTQLTDRDRYDIFLYAYNAFERLIDIDWTTSFQCPTCGLQPKVIITDGITLRFMKDLIPEMQDEPPVINSGSRHQQRVLIKDESTRATLRRFAGVGKALSLQQCREMESKMASSGNKELSNLAKRLRAGTQIGIEETHGGVFGGQKLPPSH